MLDLLPAPQSPTLDTLLDKAKTYLPQDALDAISRAYYYAECAHDGQTRKSGEPYIVHPLYTAIYLAELRLDEATLCAALLHDVVEDCGVSIAALQAQFGRPVAALVDGATKIRRTDPEAQRARAGRPQESAERRAQAKTFMKMIQHLPSDPQIAVKTLLVKLADRLHNMQTLDALDGAPRRRAIAQQTLELYALMAHALGVWEIKWKLEDLAFKHLNPVAYKKISEMLETKRAAREAYIEKARAFLQDALDRFGIDAQVTGRAKHIYGIHRKEEKYLRMNRGASDIYDLFALRVIVRDKHDCYAALGFIHSKWRPMADQIDDYIASPKRNGYQSIHTSVFCLDSNPVEVQIRTEEMHRAAEYGIAAHWRYEGGVAVSDAEIEKMLEWLSRATADIRRENDDEVLAFEEVTADWSNLDQVTVFSPTGQEIKLPKGSTPLDYAFRIHSNMGYDYTAAEINGKLVDSKYQIRDGDTVRIITSGFEQGPSLDWIDQSLGYLKTASARAKVRQWFSRQERKDSVKRGEDIYRKRIDRLGSDIKPGVIAGVMGYSNADDFFADLGKGGIIVDDVIDHIALAPDERGGFGVNGNGRSEMSPGDPASGVEIVGAGDLPIRFAKCCRLIHGDSVISVLNRSSATVHHRRCNNIPPKASDADLLKPVNWTGKRLLRPAMIRVESRNRVGLIENVAHQVSSEGVNISEFSSSEDGDETIITATVHVSGTRQLHKIFSKIEAVRGVVSVVRVWS